MRCLLTADWHIRGDAPICRVNPEEWMDDQAKSILQLVPIAKRCDEMWILGDLFHRPRTSTEATVMALKLLKQFDTPISILVGNHDALQHQYANVAVSTIGTVLVHYPELSGCLNLKNTVVRAYPFGTEPETIPDCDIWATHQLVFPDSKSRPQTCDGKTLAIGVTAQDLLERSNAKVIVTGDYHHGYIQKFRSRKVITPGCINIQASDMANYKPKCYILDTDTYETEEIPLEKFGKVHKDPNAESKEELETYMETITTFEVPHLDYIANVESALVEAPDDVRLAVTDILETYNPDMKKEYTK